jgi:hypothetical protein
MTRSPTDGAAARRVRAAAALVALVVSAFASGCSWLANEFAVLDRAPAPPAGAPAGTDAPR